MIQKKAEQGSVLWAIHGNNAPIQWLRYQFIICKWTFVQQEK